MTEIFPEKRREAATPDVFEFDWPTDEDIPDMRWLKRFAKHGLPEDMKQAHEALRVLEAIEYDGTAEQEAARTHIDAAIELFKKSYGDWTDYALAEAERIIGEYAGRIRVDGRPVVGAALAREANGEVRLRLLTDLSENP
jgi:hypothetical protein